MKCRKGDKIRLKKDGKWTTVIHGTNKENGMITVFHRILDGNGKTLWAGNVSEWSGNIIEIKKHMEV